MPTVPCGALPLGQVLIVKYTLVLVFKKIWDVILVLLLAQTLFTAVSGDVLSVVGEFVYS